MGLNLLSKEVINTHNDSTHILLVLASCGDLLLSLSSLGRGLFRRAIHSILASFTSALPTFPTIAFGITLSAIVTTFAFPGLRLILGVQPAVGPPMIRASTADTLTLISSGGDGLFRHNLSIDFNNVEVLRRVVASTTLLSPLI